MWRGDTLLRQVYEEKEPDFIGIFLTVVWIERIRAVE